VASEGTHDLVGKAAGYFLRNLGVCRIPVLRSRLDRQFDSPDLETIAVLQFRAFDSRTGKELWSFKLEATGNATPITYQSRRGKQYVAIVAGGPAHLRNVGDTSNNNSDALVAFSLSQRPLITSSEKPGIPAKAASSATGQTGDLPNAPGKDLVVRMCTKCHGIGTFVNYRMNAEEWHSEVADMVARGAQGTNDEIRAVTSFLIKHLGKRASSK